MRETPMKNRQCWTNLGLVCIALFASVGSCCTAIRGQCYIDPSTGMRVCPNRNLGWQPVSGSDQRFASVPATRLAAEEPVENALAHCRIMVGDGSTGSGTLVERDDATGLVLTCSHLFDSSTANIVVGFPNGKRFFARLVERDRPNDLAALLIRRPDAEPLTVTEEEPAGVLSACGFGPAGQFRRMSGSVTGQATPTGAPYPSLVIGCAVRPGDSGGGVLDAAGRVVGVVWGVRDGMTYATCGRPVRDFVDHVLGKARGSRSDAREEGSRSLILTPRSSPSPQLDWQAWSNEMEARIKALDDKKQDKGDYLQRGDLNGYLSRKELPNPANLATRDDVATVTTESTSRLESLREHLHTRIEERVGQVLPAIESKLAESKPGLFAGLSFGKLIVGALGLSGPLAAAVVVAAGLAGRRVRKLGAGSGEQGVRSEPVTSCSPLRAPHPVAVDSPPLPQRTVPETHYVPFEKDSFARAHQWASEQVARKYPGATEVLQAQDSLIKQCLAANFKS